MSYVLLVARNRRLDALREPMRGETVTAVTNRLKTARGHIDHVLALLENEGYTIDVMRQVAAVRGALDATVRVILRHYVEHAFVNAVKADQSKLAIDELMRALAFLRQIE